MKFHLFAAPLVCVVLCGLDCYLSYQNAKLRKQCEIGSFVEVKASPRTKDLSFRNDSDSAVMLDTRTGAIHKVSPPHSAKLLPKKVLPKLITTEIEFAPSSSIIGTPYWPVIVNGKTIMVPKAE